MHFNCLKDGLRCLRTWQSDERKTVKQIFQIRDRKQNLKEEEKKTAGHLGGKLIQQEEKTAERPKARTELMLHITKIH